MVSRQHLGIKAAAKSAKQRPLGSAVTARKTEKRCFFVQQKMENGALLSTLPVTTLICRIMNPNLIVKHVVIAPEDIEILTVMVSTIFK